MSDTGAFTGATTTHGTRILPAVWTMDRSVGWLSVATTAAAGHSGVLSYICGIGNVLACKRELIHGVAPLTTDYHTPSSRHRHTAEASRRGGLDLNPSEPVDWDGRIDGLTDKLMMVCLCSSPDQQSVCLLHSIHIFIMSIQIPRSRDGKVTVVWIPMYVVRTMQLLHPIWSKCG